jgi:nicotinate-nucleotide pyrophosphorylase (carboxylating)
MSSAIGAAIFGPAEEANARILIDLAIAEDLGDQGDVTSQATIPEQASGRAVLVARADGILAGLPVVSIVAERFGIDVVPEYEDGCTITCGAVLARLSGGLRTLLGMERIALNFLQRLSGIATQTSRFVAAVAGTKATILDTRKTAPGWRALEKYAVRCGGGQNHRFGLFDAVLIKDNHLAGLRATGDPIGVAIASARASAPAGMAVEIEVDSLLAQLDRALECRPDIILLDNLGAGELREAVRRRDERGPGILLEASGGVTMETIGAIARTGVDRISVGALTHSAPALDVALDFEVESSP